jgi:hypothetical protein
VRAPERRHTIHLRSTEENRVTGDSRPPLVLDHPRRALTAPATVPRRVRIHETGEMSRSPGGGALAFDAVSEFDVHDVGFSWRARFPIAPFLAMRVHDGYADGTGWMRGSILGVPFMRKGGPSVSAAAEMRYSPSCHGCRTR